ncbi:conserved hypothetical protein [uncultured Paludibacter sp.]|nr:conserved hypothetical protein [uncultured Paludibacter sp.]
MNKFIILLFSFTMIINSSNRCFSQTLSYIQGDEKRIYEDEKKTNIDTCKLNVYYRMTYIEDIAFPEKKSENYMILQLGKNISKFSDFLGLKADSLSSVYAKQKMDEIEAMNKLIPLQKGSSPINIFKDYPNKMLTVTDYMPMGGFYKYSEDKIKPIWKIGKDTLNVCGYNCQNAFTTYRGRNYTAWFAYKIPISDGPWKFWGLPGLILKIADDKDEYSFECAAIEKSNLSELIYIKVLDYFITTRLKFNEGLKKFYNNPNPLLENKGIIVDGKPINIKSLPYNPIELSE